MMSPQMSEDHANDSSLAAHFNTLVFFDANYIKVRLSSTPDFADHG
jgi:hypothetical protein